MPRTASRPLRRRPAALVLAASLGLLAGCGGGDGGGDAAAPAPASSPAAADPTEQSSPASPAPAEQGGDALTVTSVDFGYELDSTDLAAGEYEIELINGGGASHDLRVERDGEDVTGSEVIAPGESSTFTVALEPGEYVFYCSVGTHRSMGMEVTVTVT